MATIKDVARMAGVSPSTVSRVIANSHLISFETKKRVKKAMKKLNYVPNAIARSLARKFTSTIAVAVTTENRVENLHSVTNIVNGLEQAAQARNFNLLLTLSRSEEEGREKCLRLIQERRVDGLILLSSIHNPILINQLMEERVPFVLIGGNDQHSVPSVNHDHRWAAQTATKHLYDQGYREIMLLCSNREIDQQKGVLNGYRQYVHDDRIIESSYAPDQLYSILKQAWQHKQFDAVLMTNPFLLLSLLHFAEMHQRSIPSDLGILSLYDSPLLHLSQPSITSFSLQSIEMGKQAMNLLLDSIESPTETNSIDIRLKSELILRTSTLRQAMA
ncbi:transcriptional regulator, LacI family [Seinonella peptonophila]|uniref:Transcriptional regulator, LacI family n=1 Tax=Seinonella peptonophila TaxID=112248 RepID=A0A1M4V5G8_9BACL|nr:LacI family DNA-binding transcriptional regulator [Seinonella peptonophila]SHE64108.1 transcriptional regulator, LacI family [Seinonella peptonophila]